MCLKIKIGYNTNRYNYNEINLFNDKYILCRKDFYLDTKNNLLEAKFVSYIYKLHTNKLGISVKKDNHSQEVFDDYGEYIYNRDLGYHCLYGESYNLEMLPDIGYDLDSLNLPVLVKTKNVQLFGHFNELVCTNFIIPNIDIFNKIKQYYKIVTPKYCYEDIYSRLLINN